MAHMRWKIHQGPSIKIPYYNAGVRQSETATYDAYIITCCTAKRSLLRHGLYSLGIYAMRVMYDYIMIRYDYNI